MSASFFFYVNYNIIIIVVISGSSMYNCSSITIHIIITIISKLFVLMVTH